MNTQVELLIKRKIFASEDEAIHELVREYILSHITSLQKEIHHFEHKHGMTFNQFTRYLHERSLILQNKSLPPAQQQTLSQAVMQEEDEYLDWKAAQEMLESWLGIKTDSGS